ncbi:MAG: mechanosensitive ion channel protein, partial [Burkholderiales bacterium PBB5]
MNGVEFLKELFADLVRPTALLELAVLLGCLGVAWLVSTRLRPKASVLNSEGGIWFGQRGFDGVLFPLLALALAAVARLLLRGHLPVAVFQLAIPVLESLAMIRVSVRVLHAAVPNSNLVRAS